MLTRENFTELFQPRLALASMSGKSDVDWARQRQKWVGAAFLGAYNLDKQTLDAARGMVARGRTEFMPDDPFRFFREQIEEANKLNLIAGANVRATDPQLIYRAGKLAREIGIVLEINAHCRQPEMEEIGCGQALLRDRGRLKDTVQAGYESGAVLSLKSRFEVEGVDCVEQLNRAVEWGLDLLHVDAMDSEWLIGELEVPFLIANNGVREKKHIREYMGYGADAVSVGRAQDPEQLQRLADILEECSFTVSNPVSPDDSSDQDPLEEFTFDEVPGL